MAVLRAEAGRRGAYLRFEQQAFAPEGVEPRYEYTYGKQNWFPYSGDEHRAVLERVLKDTGLTDIADRAVQVLSGGQRRRLALALELVKRWPERLVWATNWPHPMPNTPIPDDAWVLDMMLEWIPDEAERNKAFADNPARLYGF